MGILSRRPGKKLVSQLYKLLLNRVEWIGAKEQFKVTGGILFLDVSTAVILRRNNSCDGFRHIAEFVPFSWEGFFSVPPEDK